jgi:hypothetical protein
MIRNFDKQYFQRLLLELIVTNNLPFSFVNNKVFRTLLEYLNPFIRIQRAMPGRTLIRRTIYNYYNKHPQHIVKSSAKALAKYIFSLMAGLHPTSMLSMASCVFTEIKTTSYTNYCLVSLMLYAILAIT